MQIRTWYKYKNVPIQYMGSFYTEDSRGCIILVSIHEPHGSILAMEQNSHFYVKVSIFSILKARFILKGGES